jgi:hypothetical protein
MEPNPMPVLLYVVYPYMLWSAWYAAVTGHRVTLSKPE